MESYKRLLLGNRAWAEERKRLRPGYFENLAGGQQPDFLWIGCSDSRVPAEEVTGSQPGEIFVHRNIANLFIPTDLNILSVLEFALHTLKVKHVIICGHYGCGGVKAATSSASLGILDQWLVPIKETQKARRTELADLSGDALVKKMVEFNVQSQVEKLAKAETVQRAWRNGQKPLIHGWVFDIADGSIKELVTVNPSEV